MNDLGQAVAGAILVRFAKTASAFLAAAALALVFASASLAQGHGAVDGDEGEGPLFIKMDPFLVSVFDRSAARGRLTLELVLDVPKRENAEAVRARMPRLYDSFLTTITNYIATRAAIVGAPDLDNLLAQFQAQADETLGPGIATVLVDLAMRTL